MKKSRILMMISALLLLGLFIAPMWRITLEAPQYPTPIGMNIWVNKITDVNPHDVKNINLMNHYVGMKEIPEELEEFKYFPIIAITMTCLGLLFGFLGKRKLYLTWFVIMVLLGAAGLYDFYLWEYNYGHDLDPTAAIKIPGQGYQPPLIGAKQILNFRAISLPQFGAYMMFSGIILSLLSFFVAKREKS
jgi:copper chaperone NosL